MKGGEFPVQARGAPIHDGKCGANAPHATIVGDWREPSEESRITRHHRSGRAFKMAEGETSWVEDIRQAFQELGGDAKYEVLYPIIEKIQSFFSNF